MKNIIFSAALVLVSNLAFAGAPATLCDGAATVAVNVDAGQVKLNVIGDAELMTGLRQSKLVEKNFDGTLVVPSQANICIEDSCLLVNLFKNATILKLNFSTSAINIDRTYYLCP
ncbi:MAG TPA: hypothetical protein VN132_08205 [Bdellovibrio sp.]|nr:hypothetical protein [Bdellovibrio sp.]